MSCHYSRHFPQQQSSFSVFQVIVPSKKPSHLLTKEYNVTLGTDIQKQYCDCVFGYMASALNGQVQNGPYSVYKDNVIVKIHNFFFFFGMFLILK